MAEKISRRRLAAYVADKLTDGTNRKQVLDELGAYLIESRRTKEIDLIVLDIETALANRGHVVADVSSAHGLSSELRKDVHEYIDRHLPTFTAASRGSSTITLREAVDPNLIGGVKLTFAGRELDETVRYKLQTLKASKI